MQSRCSATELRELGVSEVVNCFNLGSVLTIETKTALGASWVLAYFVLLLGSHFRLVVHAWEFSDFLHFPYFVILICWNVTGAQQ